MHHPDANRAAGMRRLAANSVVIPGRRKAAGPESITGHREYGFSDAQLRIIARARRRAPE